MFNETKLASKLYLNGYYSHQTLLQRAGGCITFSNFKHHSRVKALGTYLNWTKVPQVVDRSKSSTYTWNQATRASWFKGQRLSSA